MSDCGPLAAYWGQVVMFVLILQGPGCPAGHILKQVVVWKHGKRNISNWLLIHRAEVGTDT